MYQIICPVCANTNLFENEKERPAECSFCFTPFEPTLPVEEVAGPDKGKLCGLKLVYQENPGFIMLTGPHCVLGREHTGADLLSGIIVNGVPVISRKHCSVTLVDGKYLLKDEGSVNGTFYGVNKIDCAQEAQAIENNSIIFLGKEAFLAEYQFEETKQNEESSIKTGLEKPHTIHKYRCNEGCGFESDTYLEICPKCMTSNSMIEVFNDDSKQ